MCFIHINVDEFVVSLLRSVLSGTNLHNSSDAEVGPIDH